jgi:hypothetical protein
MFRLVLIFVFVSISLYSQSPYGFLRFNHSARGTALAGAAASIEDDVSLISYNPALIETIESHPINATFMKNVLDINSGNLSYVYDGWDVGKLGFTAHFNDWGNFERTDSDGNNTGSFGGTDMSLGAFISNELDSNFYYGIGIKYIYSGIDDVSGSAFGVDTGLFYRLNERTNLGVSVLNAGAQLIRFNEENVDMPLDVRISANHRLRGLPLMFNLALHSLADDQAIGEKLTNISVGLEVNFGKYVRARAGYNNAVREDTSINFDPGMTGFSFGGGLIFDSAVLDYSLSNYGPQAGQHRITVAFDI